MFVGADYTLRKPTVKVTLPVTHAVAANLYVVPLFWLRRCARVSVESPVICATSSAVSNRDDRISAGFDLDPIFTLDSNFILVGESSLPAYSLELQDLQKRSRLVRFFARRFSLRGARWYIFFHLREGFVRDGFPLFLIATQEDVPEPRVAPILLTLGMSALDCLTSGLLADRLPNPVNPA